MLDRISRRSILQFPEETRERFLDVFMVHEELPQKPHSWEHPVALRPKPSRGHRNVGLCVATLSSFALAQISNTGMRDATPRHAAFLWRHISGPSGLGAFCHDGDMQEAGDQRRIAADGFGEVLHT